MTREEALKIIRDMAYLSAHIVDNGVEAYEFIEQSLSQPSLPSNLDEAAEKLYPYEEGYDVDLPYPSTFDENKYERDAFKAGAEWMVGQGVTLEGHVCKDEYATEAPFYYVETENSDDFLPLIDNLIDNKVVVQIRKK